MGMPGEELFEPGAATGTVDLEYFRLANRARDLIRLYQSLSDSIARHSGSVGSSLSPEERARQIADLVASGKTVKQAEAEVDAQGGSTLRDLINQRDSVHEELFDSDIGVFVRMLNLSPERVTADPQFAAFLTPGLLESAGFVTDTGRGTGPRPVAFQFMQGPDGSVFSLNPNTGAVNKVGTFPELRERNVQLQIDRRGNLIAIDAANPEAPPIMVQEGFGFAQIDPQLEFEENQRQFEATLALRQKEVMQGFVGLELERRGQMIHALGQDLAHQIQLGQMVYTEANTQLNRIAEALNQRRAEREAVLQFAVTRSSLVERGDEMLTRLPFARQIAESLTRATGQTFTEEDFEIPVEEIDPDAVARAVIEGSAFRSPIPALQQNLAATRQAIAGIAGAPLGNAAVTQQATESIVEGVA